MEIIKRTYTYLLIITSITVMSLLGGCDEDPFNLELEPPSTLTDASYWLSPSQWEVFMNGIHHRLRTHQWSFVLLGEHRAGHFSIEPYTGATRSFTNAADNTLSEVNPDISGYGGFYTNINQLNLIIDKTTEDRAADILTEKQLNRYLGQAYGLRAYYYFHLVKSWGDVTLQLEPSYGFDIGELAKPQDPASAVMTFIKEEIERSLASFDDYSFGKGKHHWSLAATKMLKAEYYLWTARHAGGGASDAAIAKSALEDVQNNIPSLGLLTNFHDIFDQNNKDNAEVIFAIRNMEDEYTLFGGQIHAMTTRDRYTTPLYGFDSLTGQLITHDTYNIHSRGGSFNVSLTNDVYNSFSDDDSRKWATGQGIWHVEDGDTVLHNGGVWQNKYQGVIIGGLRTWYNDMPVYRYADLLLLLAEAKLLGGEDAAAEINEVRARAFAGNYNEAVHGWGNQPIDSDWEHALLRERKFEFIYEGKRWYDIRRFGDEFVEQLTAASPNQLLWPIDRGTLTDNPALVQTPGY